jgi:hypothetical protein
MVTQSVLGMATDFNCTQVVKQNPQTEHKQKNLIKASQNAIQPSQKTIPPKYKKPCKNAPKTSFQSNFPD